MIQLNEGGGEEEGGGRREEGGGRREEGGGRREEGGGRRVWVWVWDGTLASLGQSLPSNLELFLASSWLTVTYHILQIVKTN